MHRILRYIKKVHIFDNTIYRYLKQYFWYIQSSLVWSYTVVLFCLLSASLFAACMHFCAVPFLTCCCKLFILFAPGDRCLFSVILLQSPCDSVSYRCENQQCRRKNLLVWLLIHYIVLCWNYASWCCWLSALSAW